MTDRRPRLLYLGNALPPGMLGAADSYITPSVHETRLVQGLSRLADVSTVGLLPRSMWDKRSHPKDDSPGLEHEMVLWDRNPALWHRWNSWRQLRRYYLDKVQRGEMPDVLIVRDLQHVFNHFVKWLRRQPRRPLIVLLLGDSGGLGVPIPWARRFRYQFKPLQMLESQALLMYDACLVSGLNAKRFFEPRGVPWTWIPCGYNYQYAPPPADPHEKGPIRFGYFGALNERSGVVELVNAFMAAGVPGSLHMCGHGPASGEMEQLAKKHPNFHFDGFLPKPSDCLPWAQKVDVLVNVRLPFWGQDNSAPSKVFDYGVARKAILSTRTSGMDEILGEEGFYLETENFETSLRSSLLQVAVLDRTELQRRANIIHDRIVNNYSWDELACRIVEFTTQLTEQRAAAKGT